MSAGDDDPSHDYEVGYGKPPKASQFKKGNKAAQKRSAPKEKSFDQVLRDVLSRKVTLRQDGKSIKVPMREAVALRLGSDAVAGKTAALNYILSFMRDAQEPSNGVEVLDLLEEDRMILAAFQRKSGGDRDES